MTNVFDYFTEIQQLIRELFEVEVERYEEQVLTKTRGNLRLRLRFVDNSLLEINESIQIIENSLRWISYRYHYQNSVGELIFRYDNAPHHPEIKTYPNHKHLSDSVLESLHPDIKMVLREVNRHLMKSYGQS